MYELKYTGQFKKDFKLMLRQGCPRDDIETVLRHLEDSGNVPRRYIPHLLEGRYKGLWECHIRPDWLLIYEVHTEVRLVRLMRTGTHSHLF